ncbi:glycosyltransferase family 4 protein [Sphingobium algorifonticola]|uniref:Glycosyltransferase n=1 Tax=Sphingobium algorifonticola TaxID=2008318 RepID=A0A437J4W3_9SPHN|nr:glycosyltransferase family 4 protein [Sphingobium algorifonticola]RVT39823.1 glycosyltransferase [Sphingobium algorifonticola]
MKVLVVNSMAPYVWGGAEELSQHLIYNLRQRNIDAELLRLPFQWEPYSGIPGEIARFKMMKLPNVDRVISMKFPAYFISASHHTTWLIHQYRQAYDMWDSPYCNIPHDKNGIVVKDFIRAQDNEYFKSANNIFTISDEISRRLYKYNGIQAEALRAPINDPHLFTGADPSGYILAPGRINSSKRQFLLVEAMQHLPATAKLVIAGPPESDADRMMLHDLVGRLDLAAQVKLDLRFLTRQELADYVNHATAVAYLPFQEDSYGYVTMEAFEAGKAVITCRDAGEILELVIDGNTGFISEADAESLAGAMAALLYNPNMAARMGAQAKAFWRSKDINWGSHLTKLLGEI